MFSYAYKAPMKVGLITIGLAGTLFLGGCWHGPAQPPAPPTNGTTPTPTTTEAVDTSDWLTYTNEEYGFGFRYPREWGYIREGGLKTETSAIPAIHTINIGFISSPSIIVIIYDYNNYPEEIDFNKFEYGGDVAVDILFWAKDEIKSSTEWVKKQHGSKDIDGVFVFDNGRENIRYTLDGIFEKNVIIVSGNNYIEIIYALPTKVDFPKKNTDSIDPTNLQAINKELERLRVGTLSAEEQQLLLLFETITNSIRSLKK